MRALPRVVVALIAIVAYVVLWQFVGVAVVLVAWVFGLDVPGYHEVPPPGGAGFRGVIFLAGLAGVLWWVVFRLPQSSWWRRRSRERRASKEAG